MLNFQQPLPQLRKIVHHHLYKFPNILWASLIFSRRPLVGITHLTVADAHPTHIVKNLNHTDLVNIFWSPRWEEITIPPAFQEEPVTRWVSWRDEPHMMSYADSFSSLPTSIFAPQGVGPTFRNRLRSRVHTIKWLQFEIARLLAPYNRSVRNLLTRCRYLVNNGLPSRVNANVAFSVYTKPLAKYAVTQALDYVGVGLTHGWRAPTGVNFYEWYEPQRRIPLDYLRALKAGQCNWGADPTYCRQCGSWWVHCEGRHIPGVEAPRPEPEARGGDAWISRREVTETNLDRILHEWLRFSPSTQPRDPILVEPRGEDPHSFDIDDEPVDTYGDVDE